MDDMNDEITALVRQRADGETLACVEAFRAAEELGVAPLKIGQALDQIETRIERCQLGLFGYGEHKSIVKPAEEVASELERAIHQGLVLGRLPCAVAWAIAARFGIPKLHVANAAEKLGIRISQCQLGAF